MRRSHSIASKHSQNISRRAKAISPIWTTTQWHRTKCQYSRKQDEKRQPRHSYHHFTLCYNMSYPVSHLSFSALRLYMVDKYAFHRVYIQRKKSEYISPSMFEGKWYHSVLENLLKDQNQKPEDTMQSIASYCPQDLPYFDHKHSFEKSKEIVSRAIDFYLNQKPEYWIIQWVEETYEMEILPWLPKLKGVIDVIGERWNDVFLYDHKLTISIVNQEDMSPSYELQAWSYFTLYEKATGQNPKPWSLSNARKPKTETDHRRLSTTQFSTRKPSALDSRKYTGEYVWSSREKSHHSPTHLIQCQTETVGETSVRRSMNNTTFLSSKPKTQSKIS